MDVGVCLMGHLGRNEMGFALLLTFHCRAYIQNRVTLMIAQQLRANIMDFGNDGIFHGDSSPLISKGVQINGI